MGHGWHQTNFDFLDEELQRRNLVSVDYSNVFMYDDLSLRQFITLEWKHASLM